MRTACTGIVWPIGIGRSVVVSAFPSQSLGSGSTICIGALQVLAEAAPGFPLLSLTRNTGSNPFGVECNHTHNAIAARWLQGRTPSGSEVAIRGISHATSDSTVS
jgi:hypothetical protein